MRIVAPHPPLLGAAALLLALTLAPAIPTLAQSAAKTAPPPQAQHSPEELELLRGKFLEMVDTVREFSDAVSPTDARSAEVLAQARKQILKLTPQELNAFRATLNPAKMNADLPWARAVLQDFKPALGSMSRRQAPSALSSKDEAAVSYQVGLPDVQAPDEVCEALIGSGRPSSDLMIAADAVYVAAKVINAVADRACNQVIVGGVIILGEGVVAGGNTSSACVAADALLFVAENVHDKLESCDDDFTKRSVDAAVSRLGHLHDDIDASVANDNANKNAVVANADANKATIVSNDNANKTAIVTNDDANKAAIIANAEANKSAVFSKIGDSATAIIANDDANKTTIVSNDNTNKAAIVDNDNANKNTIVDNDNANKAAIIANDDANATMLRDLLLRTQIEADLSATDNAVPVALFETPETLCVGAPPLNQCGLLGLVRQIVVQTIARLAGTSTGQANAFLAKGDQYKAAGNYKAAYQEYRQAYKTAAK